MDQRLKKLVSEFRVVALTGPRQAGKTTLLRNVFPNYAYLNLEDLATYDFVKTSPMTFTRANSLAIVDEVQRVPELLSAIQVVVDERNLAGDFILSGSQNLLLSEKISQSLAGRAAYQVLLPLSIDELKNSSLLKANYLEQIFHGFYPALYGDLAISPYDYYDNYIATYVERDLRSLKSVQDLTLFRKFMALIAGRVGQLANYDSIASDLGISTKTVTEWLSVLEASYIIFTLSPYYANINRRLVKSPKIYFYDVGLATHLLGIGSAEILDTHYLRGGLFENMIIADMVKATTNDPSLRGKLSFYRDSNGNEVDLLIETAPGELLPIEIKSADRARGDYSSGVERLASWLSEKPEIKVLDGAVVYTGDLTAKNESGVDLLNWRDLAQILIN